MRQQAVELGRVLSQRYRVEAVLGRGAVGSVYRATDLSSGRPCAIKILHAAAGEDADAHARFVNEGQIIAQLFHPHIVDLQEFGTDADGTQFLAMELLSGPTLLDVIRHGKRLPLSRVVEIARQVGSALHAAHSVGIVHRDIKPQNIVLHRDGADVGPGACKEVVKVVDFGLSRMLSPRDPHTAPGIIVGTVEYMSPEATTGRREEVDARTDQWALAVVVYRLLSGSLPYQSDDAVRLLLKIRRDAHVPLAKHVPSLPPFVSAAVERALCKDKLGRFESVQDFVRALQGLPLRARTEPSARSSQPDRSNPSNQSERSTRSRVAPVPQTASVEVSAPYAEYSTAARSVERSIRAEPNTLSDPTLGPRSHENLVPSQPACGIRDAARPSASAPLTSGSMASLAPSLGGPLPASLWLALLALLMVTLALSMLVLSPAQRRRLDGARPIPAVPAAPLVYLPALLGSR